MHEPLFSSPAILAAWYTSPDGHNHEGEILEATAATRTALVLPLGQLTPEYVRYEQIQSVSLRCSHFVLESFGPPPPASATSPASQQHPLAPAPDPLLRVLVFILAGIQSEPA